jgi:hypothetical protein
VRPQRTAYSRELSVCITDALTLAQAGNDVGSSDPDGAVMVERAERTLACRGVYGLPFIDIEGPGDRYGRDARSNGALDKIFRSAAIAREAPCVDENASSDSTSSACGSQRIHLIAQPPTKSASELPAETGRCIRSYRSPRDGLSERRISHAFRP